MRRELSLQADISEAGRLNAWLDQYFAEGELSEPLREDMRLCLNEAFGNVVLYAFGEQTDPRIELTIEIEPGKVSALLADNGVAFDPLTWPRKAKFESLEDAVPGGFGLQLIRDTAGSVDYERRDGWNRLRIVCGSALPSGGESGS